MKLPCSKQYNFSQRLHIQRLHIEYFQQSYDTEMNQIQFNAIQKSLYRSASSQYSKSFLQKQKNTARIKKSLYLTILFISRATVSEHFL